MGGPGSGAKFGTRYRTNAIKKFSNRLEVYLDDGRLVLASLEDESIIRGHQWYFWQSKRVKSNMYVRTNRLDPETRKRSTPLLHRMIIEVPPGLVCDHINGNTLDNRRSNLRIATRAQNCQNRVSHKRGIGIHKGCTQNPWYARISVNRKNINLGYFKTEAEALRAREEALKEHYGEFSPTRR